MEFFSLDFGTDTGHLGCNTVSCNLRDGGPHMCSHMLPVFKNSDVTYYVSSGMLNLTNYYCR